MPRPRLTSHRIVNRRIFIICEGEKTEPNYFDEIITEKPLPGDLISIIVERTPKNTGKELVTLGKQLKNTARDQVWVVVDKDGYTKHHEAFDKANANGIKIAFSSISFEFWILLHFEYTTKCFTKADQIISYMNKKKFFAPAKFTKKMTKLYCCHLKTKTDTAIKNAIKLVDSQHTGNPGGKIYTINPYTDVHKLIESIRDVQAEFAK